MGFVPRLTAPSTSDPNWRTVASGGTNKCIDRGGGSVLPNCPGYAWGRATEILGHQPKLSTHSASTWYGYSQDGYARGSDPQLGAIICWGGGNYGGAGHVGVVEQISSDGSVLVSCSDASGRRFYTMTVKPPNYHITAKYFFQGFIYILGSSSQASGASYKDDFLKCANSHVGEDNTWVCNQTGLSKGSNWSAAFVAACAKYVGIDNKIIAYSTSLSSMMESNVTNSYGKFIDGPKYEKDPDPYKGDLVVIGSKDKSKYKHSYLGDKIGIINEVQRKCIKVIMGDVSDKVSIVSYNLGDTKICGYFRPDWTQGVSSEYVSTGGTQYVVGNLYDELAIKEDASVREVGYMNSKYEPSIKSSNINLSVINYTTMLGAVFNSVIRSSLGYSVSYGGESISTENLSGAPRTILEILTGKGLNAAAAIGVIGNIWHESKFRTDAVGDYGTSFGICQWHNDRGSAMKRMAGSDWASDLSGQVEYLWYELNSSYYKSRVLTPLLSVPNNEAGVRSAAKTFCINFEVPDQKYTRAEERANTAVKYWRQLAIQQTSD